MRQLLRHISIAGYRNKLLQEQHQRKNNFLFFVNIKKGYVSVSGFCPIFFISGCSLLTYYEFQDFSGDTILRGLIMLSQNSLVQYEKQNSLKSTRICDVTSYRLVEVYRRFRGTYCLPPSLGSKIKGPTHDQATCPVCLNCPSLFR
jgi:hypothetical protein